MSGYLKKRRYRFVLVGIASALLSLIPAFLTLRSYQAHLPDGVFLSYQLEVARFFGYWVIVTTGTFMSYLYLIQPKQGIALLFYVVMWPVGYLLFAGEFYSRVPSQSIIAIAREFYQNLVIFRLINYVDLVVFIKLSVSVSVVGYVYALATIPVAIGELYTYSKQFVRTNHIKSPGM